MFSLELNIILNVEGNMLEELNQHNFNKYIETGLKVVMFYANWCGYCKKQFAELDELENVMIGIVEVDNNRELVQRYQINSFPTFLVFKNSKQVGKFSGLHSKSDLMNKLLSFLQ